TSILPSSVPPLPPPRSTLFPYTTLFRSRRRLLAIAHLGKHAVDAVQRLEHHVHQLGVDLTLALAQDVEDVFRNDSRLPEPRAARSEEHTSELQSRENLVCRLLLEKKKIT